MTHPKTSDRNTGTPTTPLPRPSGGAPASPPADKQGKHPRRRPTRISSLHAGLIVAAMVLVLLVVFVIQNARAVDISFLGTHLRVSLAVALLSAAIAGALVVGAASTARITQLRRSARRAARRREDSL